MFASTDRIILRDFRLSDADSVHLYAADPEVTRFTSWGPNTWEDTVEFVERACASGGPQNLALCLRGTGELVGAVGAGTIVNGLPEANAVEAGWVLRRDKWRQGVMTEAVSILLEELFILPEVHKVVAFIHSDNIASQRLAERVGFSLERRHEAPVHAVASEVFGTTELDLREALPPPPSFAEFDLKYSISRSGAPTTFQPL